MVGCKFCKKEFNDAKTFSMHLTRMESDKFENKVDMAYYKFYALYGKEYVDDIINQYKDGEICSHDITKSKKNINELILALGIKRTSSEERKTKRYKEKYLASIRLKYGCDIDNLSQSCIIKQKKKESCTKKYGSYEEYLKVKIEQMNSGYVNYIGSQRHQEALIKQQETCLNRYGNRNFGVGETAKEKSRKSRKLTIESWDYEERLARTNLARKAVNSRGGYSSKPEKKVRLALTNLDIEFNTNVQKWKYNYDIIFDKYIIEIQGDMWHGNPLKYKPSDLIMGKILVGDLWKKDKRKKEVANNNGFVLIAIWECDIVNKTELELEDMLYNLLKENGYVFK